MTCLSGFLQSSCSMRENRLFRAEINHFFPDGTPGCPSVDAPRSKSHRPEGPRTPPRMFANPTEIEPIAGIAEPLSAATHLLGAGVFLVLSRSLIRMGAGSASRTAALSFYAFACVFQLLASGGCHLLTPESTAALVLLRIDHAAIFLLIAATFTPVHAILFKGPWRWGMLAFIWTAAVVGIVLKTVFADVTPTWLSATFYLAFGWVALVSGILLWRRHDYRFMSLLLYGGLAYTFGVAIELVLALNGNFQPIPGFLGGHELFHLAVLTGMGCHWAFIRRFAAGNLPELRRRAT
jgi:channel protein (hemolysin III family)